MALRLAEIPVCAIDTNETARPPDAALCDSIAEYGLFMPLSVRTREEGRFELVDGSRRLAVAGELRWQTIAALIEPAGEMPCDRDLQTIIMNRQRQNLQQLFLARHAQRLIDQDRFTQSQLARQVHLDRSTLCRMLKVLKCEDLVAALEQHEIEFGAARVLAPLPPAERAQHLVELREIAARTGRMPSVREIEARVRRHRSDAPSIVVSPERLGAVLKALQTAGVPVELETRPARQSRLSVTLALAEADAVWLHDCLTGAAVSPH